MKIEMNLEKLSELFCVFEFAKEVHQGQKRKTSGEPYIVHPIAVAKIARENGADKTTIYACLLHDVVEDTNVRLEDIEYLFGKDVAFIVTGVTKVGSKFGRLKKVKDFSRIDRRVALVKLADRVHNMQDIRGLPQKTHKRYRYENPFYISLGKEHGFNPLAFELEKLNQQLSAIS